MTDDVKSASWWRPFADGFAPSHLGWRLALVSLIAAAAFVSLLCFLFSPRWETNDDAAMSMVAHGYGLAAQGMPNLIFSNIVWGYLVRLLPGFDGAPGYTVATLAVLIVVGTMLVYGMRRSGFGYVAALSTLALVLARPVLFPQFTLNAGLLMVAAIICWHLYARQNNVWALAAGCVLALCSFLVREPECLLILIVGLPLLPVRALWPRTAARLAAGMLVAAIAISALIDREAYRDAEWRAFSDLNPVRAKFTDFGMGGYLKQRPDILERHAYSTNDIDLIQNWFFVDPALANPQTLAQMTDEVGFAPVSSSALGNAWYGVQTFRHPSLIILVLAALALAVLRPTWPVAASWGLGLAAIIAMGLLGRPGVVRVYLPLVCLLVIAPLLGGPFLARRRHLATATLLAAATVNAFTIVAESRRFESVDRQLRDAIAGFPSDTVVVWGSDFPYEAVYPVLGTPSAAMSYRLYAFGVFALAPFAVAIAEEESGRGFLARLTSEAGLPIIADDQHLGYLDTYCRERLHGEPTELSARRYDRLRVSWRRCIVAS